MRHFVRIVFALLLGGFSARAQSIEGTWQGLLHGNAGAHKIVLIISRNGSSIGGKFYSLDDGAEGEPLSSVAVQGRTMTVEVSSYGERYVATLADDGNRLTGTWTDKDHPPREVTLDRATPSTSWLKLNLSKEDLLIVQKASRLISSPTKWNRQDTRECPASIKTFSLYCSLEVSSKAVRGSFEHRDALAEEARSVIDHDVAKGNHYNHRLMGYNNDPHTTFKDVQRFFVILQDRVNTDLKASNK